MKAFERIFLYSMLAVLIFYVFLVDENVESKVAIQEEIKARRIVIVNGAGQEVVELLTDDKNNGGVIIYNKDGTPVAFMAAIESCGMMSVAHKDGNAVVAMGINKNDNGEIGVFDKYGKVIGSLP